MRRDGLCFDYIFAACVVIGAGACSADLSAPGTSTGAGPAADAGSDTGPSDPKPPACAPDFTAINDLVASESQDLSALLCAAGLPLTAPPAAVYGRSTTGLRPGIDLPGDAYIQYVGGASAAANAGAFREAIENARASGGGVIAITAGSTVDLRYSSADDTLDRFDRVVGVDANCPTSTEGADPYKPRPKLKLQASTLCNYDCGSSGGLSCKDHLLSADGSTALRSTAGVQSCYVRSGDSETLKIPSNLYILGLLDSHIVGHGLLIKDVSNVVVRNLLIHDINPGMIEAGHGIWAERVNRLWIDRVTFARASSIDAKANISDGYIDMTAGVVDALVSDSVFSGWTDGYCASPGAPPGHGRHPFVSLIGQLGDVDQRYTVSFIGNTFAHTAGRTPQIDLADEVQLEGNTWKDVSLFQLLGGSPYPNARDVGGFAIKVFGSSRISLRSNTFDSVRDPVECQDTNGAYVDCNGLATITDQGGGTCTGCTAAIPEVLCPGVVGVCPRAAR